MELSRGDFGGRGRLGEEFVDWGKGRGRVLSAADGRGGVDMEGNTRARGFTIVELLAVCGVVGVMGVTLVVRRGRGRCQRREAGQLTFDKPGSGKPAGDGVGRRKMMGRRMCAARAGVGAVRRSRR